MILISKPRIRPVFRYRNRTWIRQEQPVEADGHSITTSGFSISEDQLTDLTADVGVVCYGAVIDNTPTVFDFSSMHLCPCQLKRVRMILK